MNRYLSGLLWTCIVLSVLFSASTLAATLTGQIEVKKKNGRRNLDSFEYAVISLVGKNQPMTPQEMAEPIIINQKDKRFFPRLMPIVAGQTVHFYNQDELDHNVFSTEKKQSFDLGRYPKGDFRPVKYTKTGNYKVYCNIHQKMVLDIVVLKSRYFGLTNEKGEFTIENVPAGTYQLKVWHIYGGMKEQTLTVAQGDNRLELISVVSTKVVREVEKHKNKHGKKYKKRGRYRRN
jgi:plastocyanin